MIKILHIVSDLDINSGALNVVMNYYRHIDREKIQFDFGYFNEMDEGTYKDEIMDLGGKIFFFNKPSFSLKYQHSLDAFFSEKKDEYVAVHCHPIWASEIIGRAAKKSGIKHIIQHSHSTKYGNNMLSSFRNRLLMFGIGFFATDYAACSEEAAKLFRKKTKITIIRNAIDCNRFTYSEAGRKIIRDEFEISDKELVIGHVGRFSEEKNQIFLIDIFKSILDNDLNAKLILIGDGPMKEQILTYIGKDILLSENTILTGKRTDIPNLLSSMDIFVLPSKYEGVPFAAIEAQACGLPCVISENVTTEIKTDLTVYISLKKDHCIWADTIMKEISKKHNRKTQSHIKELGYDISIEAVKLGKYYESFLE